MSAAVAIIGAPTDTESSSSLPLSIEGTSPTSALETVEGNLLADPVWPHYEYWRELSKEEQADLLKRATKLAQEVSDSSDMGEVLTSALKELVRLKSLGVPGSASASPTATEAGSLPRSGHSTMLSSARALGRKTSLGALSSRSLTSIMSGWSLDSGERSPVLTPNPSWRSQANNAHLDVPPKSPPRGSPRSTTPQPPTSL